MENGSLDPVTVLAMNIRRCEHCRTKLKDKLLQMPGVNSCDMDIENNLVLVMGTLDPMILAKDVAKLGKRVELLSYDKYPKKFKEKLECNNTKRSGQERGKKHKNIPCNPLLEDEKACMDYFCKVHPKFRNVVEREPVDNYATPSFFPMDGGFGPYGHSCYETGSYARYPFGYM